MCRKVSQRHMCENKRIFEHRRYGIAIGRCIEDPEGRLWCHNDEYESRVNFCPFCGYKAPQQVEVCDGISSPHFENSDEEWPVIRTG